MVGAVGVLQMLEGAEGAEAEEVRYWSEVVGEAEQEVLI